MFYEGNGIGGNCLVHYGRKGMKWGKNIFDSETPRGREKHITGTGEDIYRRGEGLGNGRRSGTAGGENASDRLPSSSSMAAQHIVKTTRSKSQEMGARRTVRYVEDNLIGAGLQRNEAGVKNGRSSIYGNGNVAARGTYDSKGRMTEAQIARKNDKTITTYTRNTTGSDILDSIVRGVAKLGLKALDTKLGQKIADKVYENSKEIKMSEVTSALRKNLDKKDFSANKGTPSTSVGVLSARSKLNALSNYGNTWKREVKRK